MLASFSFASFPSSFAHLTDGTPGPIQAQCRTHVVPSNADGKARFDQNFRFEFMDPDDLGNVVIEHRLIGQGNGLSGVLAGRLVLKSNELLSLLHQDIGWSSSECRYRLHASQEVSLGLGSQLEMECPGAHGNQTFVKCADYATLAFSVVPRRSAGLESSQELEHSVLHASWGGIRPFDMEELGSRLVFTETSPCEPFGGGCTGTWRKHLLYRAGQTVVGLPAKSEASHKKILIVTIIAVQNLTNMADHGQNLISCRATTSSAKQVSSIAVVYQV